MRAICVKAAKAVIYHAGLSRFRRRDRTSATLTVLMYHRVLPAGHPQRLESIDDYVLTPRQFAGSLDVVQRLCRPVSIASLLAYLDGGEALPPNAALITFDDGWLDTLTIAGPELKRRGLPALLFIPPAIFEGDGPFWQERLVYATRTGKVDVARMRAIADAAGCDAQSSPADTEAAMEWLVGRLTATEPTRRARALQAVAGDLQACDGRHFIAAEDIPSLTELGFEIGCHGLSHDALPTVQNPGYELARSREILSRIAGRDVATMSFPQGRYTEEIAAAAFSAGYRAVFTSDSLINLMPNMGVCSRLFGRVGVNGKHASKGQVADSLAANRTGLLAVAAQEGAFAAAPEGRPTTTPMKSIASR